jgi:hypothetical protein
VVLCRARAAEGAAKRLDEYPALGRFFFSDDLEWDDAAVEEHLGAGGAPSTSALLRPRSTLETFDAQSIELPFEAWPEPEV